MTRKGFIIDLNKCTGCNACVLACAIENAGIQLKDWREVRTYNELKTPGISVFHYSLACNHCDQAPCKPACPAEAFSKDMATGAIVHHEERCIGCRYCTWACPYDAPKYSIEKGVVEKCTFCLDRITDGGKPACCLLCPTGALDYGEIIDEAPASPGFDDFGIAPAINIVSHRLPAGPEVHYMPEDLDWAEKGMEKEGKAIHLEGEWPLAVFTFIASVMVGMVSGVMFGEVSISPLLFLFSGVIAGGVSIVHLGKRTRAWRSVVHLKDSWLSREIIFFGLFFITGIWFSLSPDHMFIGYISLASGLGALFSIDRVYDFVRAGHRLNIHSADTLLTGILFSAWFAGSEPLLLISIAVKAALFISQEIHGDSFKEVSAWLRVTIGFALPVVLFPFFDLTSSVFILIILLVGEAIDRGRFYNNLQKLSL